MAIHEGACSRAISLWLLVGLALGVPPTVRATAEDEPELMELARRFPPEPRAEDERELLTKLTERTGLRVVEVRAPGVPGPELAAELATLSATARVHELVAEGNELAAALYPARLRSFSRPTLVESLELLALGPSEVRLTARIAFPALDPFEAGLESARALLRRVDEPARPMAALLDLAQKLDGLPVGITRFHAAGALKIDAIAGGRRAVADFETALSEAGLDDVEVSAEPFGYCLALSATARLGDAAAVVVDSGDRESYPLQLFFPEAESLCAREEAAPVLRASDVGPGAETSALRLRGARRGDALHLLERATGRPWVGFGAPEPRVDLDLAARDAEAAIAALRTAGVPLRRFGEVVLWSDAATDREPDLPYEGDPVTLAMSCAEIPLLLELFEQLTGLGIEAAPGVEGCVDAFASERPWDELFESVLVAAGLDYRIDGATVHVAPARPDAPTTSPVRAGPSSFDPRWSPPLERVEAGELRLIGLLRDGEAWRAFAEGPLGRSYELTPGASLADAVVESVDEAGARVVRGAEARTLELP